MYCSYKPYQSSIKSCAFLITDEHSNRGPLRHINAWPAREGDGPGSLWMCAIHSLRASVKDGWAKWRVFFGFGSDVCSDRDRNVEIRGNISRNRDRAVVHSLHTATPFEIHGTVKAGLTRQSKRELLHSGKNRLWGLSGEKDVQKWAGVTVIFVSRRPWE